MGVGYMSRLLRLELLVPVGNSKRNDHEAYRLLLPTHPAPDPGGETDQRPVRKEDKFI